MGDPKPTRRIDPNGRARIKRFMRAGIPQGRAQPKREFNPETGMRVGGDEVKHEGLTADIVRYGVPATAGALAPSLALPVLIGQSLIAGGSEVAARRIERASEDPELDSIWSDIKAGGVVGALDIGVGAATRGIGTAFRYIGKKLFIPSEIPLEVRIAQETLGDIPAEQLKNSPLRKFIRWVRQKPASRPFSLTYGQLSGEERNFISWLEGMSRAGIGSRGVMSKFDLRNERAVIDLIEQYVENRGTQLTGPEFASFARQVIGDVNKQGEMFTPVVAYRKYLYKQFEDALERSPATVDGSALREYIQKFGPIEEGLPRKIYQELRANGLVPPLKATSTTRRTVTNVKTTKIAEQQIDQTRDLTRTNLVTGKEKRTYDATQGTKAASDVGTAQTVREYETVGGLTEKELAADWASLPPSDVDKAIKLINAKWKNGMDERNNVLKFMGRKIEDPFMKVIKRDAALDQLHSAADAFFKKEVNFMRNGAIKGLRKTLSESPSKALALLGGGTSATPAREVYDRLLHVKKALQFSSEAPRVGEGLAEALTETGVPAGREALERMYDQTFLRPLRYDTITRNVDRFGNLEPARFLDMLNANADVPEFYREVFGGTAQVDEIKRFMTTLTILKQPPKEKNIFIQLAQAGQIGGMAAGIGGAFLSDDPEVKTGSLAAGTAIFLGPYALARMFTNARMTRMFTDGIEEGIRSGRFAIALRKVAEMKVATELVKEAPTQDAINFYSSLPQPGQE